MVCVKQIRDWSPQNLTLMPALMIPSTILRTSQTDRDNPRQTGWQSAGAGGPVGRFWRRGLVVRRSLLAVPTRTAPRCLPQPAGPNPGARRRNSVCGVHFTRDVGEPLKLTKLNATINLSARVCRQTEASAAHPPAVPFSLHMLQQSPTRKYLISSALHIHTAIYPTYTLFASLAAMPPINRKAKTPQKEVVVCSNSCHNFLTNQNAFPTPISDITENLI